MSGFTGKSNSYLSTVITTTAFWPALNLGDCQRIYRLPTYLDETQIRHHVNLAALDVNQELFDNMSDWLLASYADLAAVDVGLNTDYTALYQNAVYIRAKATLLRDYDTFSRRDIASNDARDSVSTWQHLLATSRRYINQIKGRPAQVSAALI